MPASPLLRRVAVPPAAARRAHCRVTNTHVWAAVDDTSFRYCTRCGVSGWLL